MKTFRSTKNLIDKAKNGKNIASLDVFQVALVHGI